MLPGLEAERCWRTLEQAEPGLCTQAAANRQLQRQDGRLKSPAVPTLLYLWMASLVEGMLAPSTTYWQPCLISSSASFSSISFCRNDDGEQARAASVASGGAPRKQQTTAPGQHPCSVW